MDKSVQIQNSQYEEQTNENHYFFSSSIDAEKEYHYIDLLGIIQNVLIPD